MNLTSRLACITFGSLVLSLMFSCAKPESGAAQPDSGPAGEVLAETPGESALCLARFRAEALPWLEKGDYDALEAEAESLRKSRVDLANGYWQLGFFYEALSDPGSKLPDAAWAKRGAAIRAWVGNRPQSITARVALARFLNSYAWDARGGGWASTVTDEGQRLMDERLQESREILRDAASLPQKCPAYFTAFQTVALGQGWDREEYDRLFKAAIDHEPAYTAAYFLKAQFLFKRWYGASDSEWLEFITKEADNIGGVQGDVLYARVACHVFDYGIYDQFLAKSGVQWDRVKRGLEAVIKLYPDSVWAKSQLCYFCGQKGEQARCIDLWKDIGPNVDTSIWNRKRFLADRKWATGK